MSRFLRDDDEDLLIIYHVFSQRKKKRRIKWMHDRLDWNDHVEKLRHTKTFESKLRMKESAFDELVDLLRPAIAVDEKRSVAGSNGNDPIYPEMMLSIGLRWLAGEVEKSLDEIHRVSFGTTHRIVSRFLFAVNTCESLAIRLPTTDEELKKVADGFDKVSSAGGLFYGVVGCIDGWLCTHNAPKGVRNPLDYFNGHYQCMGTNVQAICDAQLRFIYVAFAAPGKTNDVQAFRKLDSLHSWQQEIVSRHGPKYFLLGDNAYTLNDSLLIPYSGASRRDKQKDSFNFFLSEQRIRIEMTFGLLSSKWRIFRRKTEYQMTKVRDMVNAATRLHNFIIDCQIASGDYSFLSPDEETNPMTDEPSLLGYFPTTNEALQALEQQQGTSPRREYIKQELAVLGLERPQYNIERNSMNVAAV